MLLLILLVCSFILLLLNKVSSKENLLAHNLTKIIAISALIACLLELTIFNYRFYESFLYKNDNLKLSSYEISKNISCKNNECTINDNSEAYIEYLDLNHEVNNLFLNFKADNIINYKIAFTDESSSEYIESSHEFSYSMLETRSHYLRIHALGKVQKLKIIFTKNNKGVNIKEVYINKRIPFIINNLRVILNFIIIGFISLIFSKTSLKDITLNGKSKILITAIIINVILFIINILSSFNNTVESCDQYKYLAEALYNGHFALKILPNEALLKLSNPYDYYARNFSYLWDFAYFKGKYYVYFGIVPCLLTYLPYYIITKTYLKNRIAAMIGLFLLVIASFYLIYQLSKRYFPKISYIWYILISIFYLLASGIMVAVAYPSIYNIPVIYGLSFANLALGFWIKALDKNKIKKRYLFLGSLCASLVAGCRPQMLVVFFIAIPLFWNWIFKTRKLFTKKSLQATLALVLPIIVIACFIMYYNYARFGSVFDFGATYNLTTNDMTRRGFVFDRTFTGIFYYLFSPLHISNIYPFLESYDITTTYVGKTIFEPFSGGFFAINIICLIGLFIKKFKNVIKSKELYNFCIISLIMVFTIIIVDTQMSGILQRYILDFGWLISLSSIIIILSILSSDNLKEKYEKILKVLILLSIVCNCLTFLTEPTLVYNEKAYNMLYYMFVFWH